jgi:hypothetical protein
MELRQRALELAQRKGLKTPRLPPVLPGSVPPALVQVLELLVTPSAHTQTLLAIGSADDIVLDQRQRSLAERLVRFIVLDKDGSQDISPMPHCSLELDVILVRKGVKAGLSVNATGELALRHEILLEAGASLTLRVAHCNSRGSHTRQTTLLGPGASLDDKELVVMSDELGLDNVVVHAAQGTKADVLQAGIVLDGMATSSGLLRVLSRSQKTETVLRQHWLLLGDKARASASPMLEIEANDVNARHSAMVKPIEEGQLFYFAQRGIPPSHAKRILAKAVVNSVIETWPEQGRQALDAQIDTLLEGHGVIVR